MMQTEKFIFKPTKPTKEKLPAFLFQLIPENNISIVQEVLKKVKCHFFLKNKLFQIFFLSKNSFFLSYRN